MRDVKRGKFGKKNQGQSQASKFGRAGRRGKHMNGNDGANSHRMKVDTQDAQ